MALKDLLKAARDVLEKPFWIPELDAKTCYERVHDDCDGKEEGKIVVFFDNDGDAYVGTDKHHGLFLRFRNLIGGGMSLRVRAALMLLAWAIKLDNEEKPQIFQNKKGEA